MALLTLVLESTRVLLEFWSLELEEKELIIALNHKCDGNLLLNQQFNQYQSLYSASARELAHHTHARTKESHEQ